VALNAGVMSRPKGVAVGGDDPLRWMSERYDLVRSVNLDGVAYGVLATVEHLSERGGAICPAGVDTSMVPPDYREAGYAFAPPDHIAEALETILDSPPEDAGVIWVTMSADQPIWRYEFAPLR